MRNLANKSFSDLILKVMLVIAIVFQSLFFIYVAPALAANPPPIQTFFLSMPEDQVLASFKKITTSPAAPMVSVTGISVTTSDTQIYYDQWENGYELDLANPTNIYPVAGGTQIWGNGLAADGCPPNIDGRTPLVCTNANDILSLGNTIVLNNEVPLPRTSAVFYDGRDKLGSNKVIAVTRSLWAKTPGTVLADAVEVYDTTRWGTYYEMPVGENTTNNPSAGTNTLFSYSSALIIASQNATSITIDPDGPGATAAIGPILLNQGDAYQVNGGMKMGGTVTSNNPIQVNLLTGKVGSTYASRWFSLPPSSGWTNSLWTSVGTTVANYPSTVFVFNPSDSTALTVNYETKLGTGSFSVPVNGTYRFEMPLLSGAHFYTSGTPFQAVGGMDTSLTGADQTYDWGYTLVPDTWLTTAFVAGWAPGTADYTGNGSPVWVTAIKPTTIYVDYGAPSPVGGFTDPNGKPYNVSYPLGKYESLQIKGAGNTQTGMKVWTVDGTSITGAWGEDPKTAAAGTPYLDVGYTIPPLPMVVLTKSAGLATGGDVNNNGKVDAGDTIQYSLTVENKGAVMAFNTVVTDSVPLNTTYVTGSTKLGGLTVPDNSSAPLFPLTGSGVTIPTLAVGASTVLTYQMKTDTIPPASYTEIVNTAKAELNGDTFTVTLRTPLVPVTVTSCALTLMNNTYASTVTSYQQNGIIYVQVTDTDKNTLAGTAETITVQVVDTTTSDRQALILNETGVNMGIFQGSLPSSTTLGQLPDDGTLYALAGDSFTAAYTDPTFGDTCNALASIVVTSTALIKQLYLSDPSATTYSAALDRVLPTAGSPVLSGLLSAGSISTISIGGTTTGGSSVGAILTPFTFTFNHAPTAASGSNRLLLVSVATGGPTNASNQSTVTGVTFAGTSMHLIGSAINGTANSTNSYIYYLKDSEISTSASANVVVTTAGTSTVVASATTFINVDQTIPYGTYRSATGTTGTITLPSAYVSATGEVVYSIGSIEQGTNARAIATPAGQTQLWNVSNHGYVDAATSTMPGAASVTPSYTNVDNRAWTIGVISIKPATGAGNSTATYTQSPAMAGNFTMPANGAITVKAYVMTVSNLPTNPTITATLKHGSTTFATLTNPVYDNIAGTITWTGSVGGSIVSVSSAEAISLTINTTQGGGASFQIQYDGSAKASVIELPTTTVIKVDSLDFYDAPYPGGVLISNPASGQTVYIRASVSDPFGDADITSATLDITDPASGHTTPALVAVSPSVPNSGSVKIYETSWSIPAATGDYIVKVRANEGSEGAIFDERSKTVTVAFQDTGTPSTTEFTSTSNGTATSSYDSTLSPTNQICIRVIDIDQNTNPSAAETITVTLSSSTGDSVNVTLTETGVNTGIFVNCVTREASSVSPTDIYAVAGSVLTVNYIDPNDPSDATSASAVMTTTSLTLSVSKQLVEPTNSIATIGEQVKFDFTVANPNSVELHAVAVTDTFPACLTFVSSSVTPTSQIAPTLTWTDIGPLASHVSRTISLTFTVNGVCAPGTNTVSSSALNPSNTSTSTVTDSADVTATDPKLTVSKTRTTAATANLGEDVTFHIIVTNTGTTQITTLPLIDHYSAYCMEYKSDSLDPGWPSSGTHGSGGTVSWSNLGPLNASTATSVDVTFVVRGPCNPAQNLAIIDSAVDTNGDPVPVVQSSDTVITQVTAPTMTKGFSPAMVLLNGVSTLTFTITNPNLSGAMTGVGFSDTYPLGMENASPLTVVNTTCGGTLDASAGGTTISYSGGSIPANSSCIVSINVLATAFGSLNNVSGTVAAVIGGTGNTASSTLYVFDPQPSKLLVATSESFTGIVAATERVAIGEMVRYRLATRIPQGMFVNVQLLDGIPNGLQFLNDGTATVAFVCNGGAGCMTSSTLSGAGLVVSGSSSNVSPAFVIPGAAITGGPFGSGTDITFSLGNITNSDSDSDSEYIVVEFNALVLNANSTATINQGVDNQTGANVSNNRQNDVTLRINGSAMGSASPNVTVSVAEPAITSITKSVTPAVGPYYPGDSIVYTLTFTNHTGNTNDTTAFDISLTDTLDSNLTVGTVTPSTAATTQGATCAGGTSFTSSSTTTAQLVTISISCLDPGRSVTATIAATIKTGTSAGTINNNSSLTYSSLPGLQGSCAAAPFICISIGTSGSATGERNGSGGAGADITVLNNYYAASNTVPMAVTLRPDLTASKSNDATLSTVAVGGTFNWTVRVSNAAGTDTASFVSGNTILIDNLPTSGATYPATATATKSAGTTGTIDCAISGNTLTCTANGAVTIPAGEYFDAKFLVTTNAAGSLVNPATGGINKCQVDPNTVISESDETNNNCGPNTVTVSKSTPILTTTASGPVIAGSNITDTAHLTGGYGTLGGTITFDVYAPGDATCTTPLTAPTGATVAGAGDYTSGNFATAVGGSYRWIAHYSGDANNNAINNSCNDANETSTVIVAAPALTIVKTKTSTGPYIVGDTIPYSIVVTNTGNVTLHNLNVTDSSASIGTCTPSIPVSNLAPNTTITCLASHPVTQANVDNGSYTNTASVSDNDVCPTAGASVCNSSVTVNFTPDPNLTIVKTKTSTGPYIVGDMITYSIVVKNTGNVTLHNLNVTDSSALIGTCTPSIPVSNLAPNAVITCLASHTVTQTNVNNGGYANTASVADDDVCPTAGTSVCSSSVTVNFDNIDLSLTKTVNNPSPRIGDAIIFTLTITNHSLSTAATSVVVADVLPAGLTFNSAIPSIGLFSNPNWTIATLAANTSATLKLNVTATQVGVITNTAEIAASDQPDPDLTNNQASESIGSLFDPPSGIKTFNDSGLPELEFRMVWINSGNTTAINTQVTDNIPTGTTYVSGSLTCAPQGSSSNAIAATVPLNSAVANSFCAFVPINNGVIQWQGSIGSDNGNLTEATAANEVVITFRVTVNDSVNQVFNFATSRTDTDGNSDFTNDNVLGASLVLSNQTTWNRISTGDPETNANLPKVLPATGFAPNVITTLPQQPADKLYSETDVRIEIPNIGMNIPIVGVPLVNSDWDVSWLWQQAGWLNGTAFPGWQGNSVLTGHVTLPNGKSGPFEGIGKLKWGDKIIIHAYGSVYTYVVRETRTITPKDMSVLNHEDEAWLTLLTCKTYNERTNIYANRIAVRAVLLKVEQEKLSGDLGGGR